MTQGLIFTDTASLGNTLHARQSEVMGVLHAFVSQCANYINWCIVDVSDAMYASEIDSYDWRTYVHALEDHYYGLGLDQVEQTPLFIIGGEDEIPMPQIENPLVGYCGREYLSTDMLYCFERSAENDPSVFLRQRPRFVAGRLPLSQEHNLSDLTFYLQRCVGFLSSGISVRGAAMTTTASWIPASKEMMENLPVAPLSDENVPLNNRMIVSPLLDSTYEDMYEGYVHELKKVDFLVCNLHGSAEEGTPEFWGEYKERNTYLIAVQPSMLSYTSPLIFNTVACYGGRYAGYSIDDSMLYSALCNGTMLYTGSGDVALGGFEEGGNSELLMKLYNIYLHQGMPAGLALMKAKRDYYHTCHSDDGDESAMYTILEFNLFGCPILSMQPKISADYRPSLHGHRLQEKGLPTYHPKQLVRVSDSAYDADDVLDYVRRKVDGNLMDIRTRVEKEVYQRLGLSYDALSIMVAVMDDGVQVGWTFVYQQDCADNKYFLTQYFFVTTDNDGQIKRIIHSK